MTTLPRVLAALFVLLLIGTTTVAYGQHRRLDRQETQIRMQKNRIVEQAQLIDEVVYIQETQNDVTGKLIKNQEQLLGLIRMQFRYSQQTRAQPARALAGVRLR
jgi:hypothetical protein